MVAVRSVASSSRRLSMTPPRMLVWMSLLVVARKSVDMPFAHVIVTPTTGSHTRLSTSLSGSSLAPDSSFSRRKSLVRVALLRKRFTNPGKPFRDQRSWTSGQVRMELALVPEKYCRAVSRS